MRRTSKAAVGAGVAAAVGAGLLLVGPSPGDKAVNLATSPHAARPGVDTTLPPAVPREAPPSPLPPLPQAPVVDKREVTRPGEGTTDALFYNGRVYRLFKPQKRYLILHADGSQGERIEDAGAPQISTPEGVPVPQLPPRDPSAARAQPTPEQRAQMERISVGQPVGPPAAP